MRESEVESDAKARLVSRLRVLFGREERLAHHLRGEDGRHEADSEDVVSFVSGDEVLEGLEAAALQEIREIRAALSRLEHGTWGTCERCGEPIDAERLGALPQTTLCRSCAT